MKLLKKLRTISIVALIVLVSGFFVPEKLQIPVAGATNSDWNHVSFWYEPWRKSGVHKGIDIFGQFGQRLNSSSSGVALFTGNIPTGGNVVIVLGPRWKLHYYAHLDSITVNAFDLVSSGSQIGTVGDSGNAKGKQPHLHYSIVSILPRFWRIDNSTQGWKKAFFLDPGAELAK